MTIEYRSFSFTPATGPETRAADVAGDKLAGHAIVYERDSHFLPVGRTGFIERVAPGALTRSLTAAAERTLNIHALWSHDSSQPLGSTRGGKLKLESDPAGLAFELDTARFNPMQLDAARDGDLQMSFGFRVVDEDFHIGDDGTPVRTLLDVDLFEISPVISPAYPDTTAALRSLEAWEANRDAWRAASPAAVTFDTREEMEAFTEQPQENIATSIKRALTLKAIEQHIRHLPAA